MFKPKLFAHGETEYDKQISRIVKELETHDPGSEEYESLVDQLKKIQQMRTDDRTEKLNPNTVALVGANIFGIVMVVRHEQFNLIVTKALGLVMRLPSR